MGTGRGVVALPWMAGSREERYERLRAFFEAGGDRMAAAHAGKRVDDPLANLCGDCGPILEELAGGLEVSDLAVKWGVPERTIYGHLLRYGPEELRAVSAAKALGRRQVCVERLEGASDNVGVSKWRALLQSAEWDLERLVPKLYGAKPEVGGLSIVVNVDRSCGGAVTIDAEGGGVSQRLVIEGAEASVGGVAG